MIEKKKVIERARMSADSAFEDRAALKARKMKRGEKRARGSSIQRLRGG